MNVNYAKFQKKFDSRTIFQGNYLKQILTPKRDHLKTQKYDTQ